MSDLRVDYAELAHSRDELAALIEEFHNAESIAADGDVGSAQVLDALHEFASNWKVHKQRLIEEMTAVHDMVDKTIHGFLDADNALAKNIADAITTVSR